MSGLAELGNLWNSIQTRLFPVLEDELGELDDRHRPALRRLCGWETLGEIPGESTFSRAFATFAEDQLPQHIHEAMIQARYGDKIAGHISRDATAIHGREKAARKEPKPVPPAKGEGPASPQPTRLQRQLARTRDENLADLPRACDWGTKKDSKGKKQSWRGEKRQFAPAQAIRYRQRSSAERVNSHLHDNHGARHVRVRGAAKVAAHLSFGLLVIAAEQLLAMLC